MEGRSLEVSGVILSQEATRLFRHGNYKAIRYRSVPLTHDKG